MERSDLEAGLSGSEGRPAPGFEVDPGRLNVAAASFRDRCVKMEGTRRLVIGPNLGSSLFSYGFAVGGGGVLAFGIAGLGGEQNPGVAILVGGLFLAVGLAMVAARRRFVFDLDERCLQIRSVVKGDLVPLAEIRAVQVIDGGYHSAAKGGGYTTYQLNLVLGEGRGRLGLSNHADRDWTAETGVALAEFLGVPLFSSVSVRSAEEKARIAGAQRRLQRRVAFGMAGAFLGFLGGFVGSAALFVYRVLEIEQLAWVFPLSLFGGLALGAVLGVWISFLQSS